MRLDINSNRFKEDLEWAVKSPPLMRPDPNKKAFGDALLPEITRWLQYHQPEPPKAIEDCARLGIYFEHLWKYIFEQCPLFDLVAHNLPVYKDKQTQGAFDFIYYCHYRQRYFHLEVAVKFYLGIRSTAQPNGEWHNWIGPGGEDRLDLKLNKMLSKQSELSNTEQGRTLLKEMGIEAITPELLLKGRLFYPLGNRSDPPRDSDPEHLRGNWLGIDQLERLPQHGNWRPLPRSEWLSDRAQGDNQGLGHAHLAREIERRFQEYRFPVMLGHTPETAQQNGQLDRYFITPERWQEDIAGQMKSEC